MTELVLHFESDTSQKFILHYKHKMMNKESADKIQLCYYLTYYLLQGELMRNILKF